MKAGDCVRVQKKPLRDVVGQETQCVDGEVVREETIMKAPECPTETRGFCLVFFFALFVCCVFCQ